MKFEVNNFRGCAKAVIELTPEQPIALVAAPNAGGKSSIAQAIGVVLSGKCLPFEGMTSKDAGSLVKLGNGNGSVYLTGLEGRAKATYPEAKYFTEGTPPTSTAVAVQFQSLTNFTQINRAAALQVMLDVLPTEDDLKKALANIEISEPKINETWNQVKKHGWDKAYELNNNTGKELKGRFRQTTNVNWGSDQGAKFLPPNWESDLDGVSVETLEAELTTERAALEDLLKIEAIDEHKSNELLERFGGLDKLKKELEEKRREEERQNSAVQALMQEEKKLPRPPAKENEIECSFCGKHGVVKSGKLVAVKSVTDEEIAKMNQDLEEMKEKIKEAKIVEAEAGNAALKLRLEIDEAVKAHDKYIANSGTKKRDEAAIEKQRTIVSRCEKRLAARKTKLEAESLHNSIMESIRIQDVLHKDGLRAHKLNVKLAEFNEKNIKPLCEAAGYKSINIDEDFRITYDGRIYDLVSKSEQYRVRMILQIAMAQLDNSAVLVFDEADILDREGRSGLMSVIQSIGIPSIICMTMDSVSDVPNLADFGIGQSYWIENDTAEIIPAQEPVAA